MSQDDRPILELLKDELALIENGRLWTLGAHAVVSKVSL